MSKINQQMGNLTNRKELGGQLVAGQQATQQRLRGRQGPKYTGGD